MTALDWKKTEVGDSGPVDGVYASYHGGPRNSDEQLYKVEICRDSAGYFSLVVTALGTQQMVFAAGWEMPTVQAVLVRAERAIKDMLQELCEPFGTFVEHPQPEQRETAVP